MLVSEGLTFDDVLLAPKYSEIKSRSDVDVSVELPKGFKTKLPIIPANMKTVTGYEMAKAMFKLGGMALIHRFMPESEQLEIVGKLAKEFGSSVFEKVGVSIGVKKADLHTLDTFVEAGVRIVCVDVAHGDSKLCIDMCEYISGKYPNVLLIAGSVATADGAKRLWGAGVDIIKAGIGNGCFGAGTRILMANGFYKNIETIKKGDYVINKNGKSVKVTDAFCTGIKKVAKLRNNSFYVDTYVTPDHKFWVGDLGTVSKETISNSGYVKILNKSTKQGESKYKWKTISDASNDVLLFPKDIKFMMPEHFEISLKKRTTGNWRTGYAYELDSTIKPSYDSGYLFGTFLGDGHAFCAETNGSHIGNVKWYFGKNEMDVATKLSNSITNIFTKEPNIKVEDNIITVALYYKPLADFLLSFGKKQNKSLPENLLVANNDYLKGLYDGLMDSDGHYDKDGRNTLGNTSKYVIELFNTLVVILNGYILNNANAGKKIGGLQKCNADNLNDVYVARTIKQGSRRITNDYCVVKNLGYEELNIEMPVYDITVDCDTHSFVANNMIVHNSICTTRIETGNGVPLLTTLDAIAFSRKAAEERLGRKLMIMCDGGVRTAGDCVKALCFADLVMSGNCFAGTEEAPGDVVQINGKYYKSYVGSSTHKTNHVEGVAAIVPMKDRTEVIMRRLIEGIRSGCSYQGVPNVSDLKNDPHFVRMTGAGLKESGAHDVVIA